MTQSISATAASAQNGRQFGIMAKIMSGYVTLLVILMIVAAGVLITFQDFVDQFREVAERDFQVIQYAKDLEMMLVSVVASQRTFIIAGDEVSLENYHASSQGFDLAVQQLTELIDDEDQLALLQQVADNKNEWMTVAGDPEIERRQNLGSSRLTEGN